VRREHGRVVRRGDEAQRVVDRAHGRHVLLGVEEALALQHALRVLDPRDQRLGAGGALGRGPEGRQLVEGQRSLPREVLERQAHRRAPLGVAQVLGREETVVGIDVRVDQLDLVEPVRLEEGLDARQREVGLGEVALGREDEADGKARRSDHAPYRLRTPVRASIPRRS